MADPLSPINWKRVNERLRCPICNDEAFISPGTDGMEGQHTHRFAISREMARKLSEPTVGETSRRIKELEDELKMLRDIIVRAAPPKSEAPK